MLESKMSNILLYPLMVMIIQEELNWFLAKKLQEYHGADYVYLSDLEALKNPSILFVVRVKS
jgi:hypothetical protein